MKHIETRQIWREYEKVLAQIRGWNKATGWKPDVPPGTQTGGKS